MRYFGAGLLALFLMLLAGPSSAAKQQLNDPFGTQEQILQWINDYRLEPQPNRLPAAVKAMARLGLFRDQDTAGMFVGFMAGVLGSNPKSAEKLVTGMFPMPPEDQAAIIKAIAYSGLPNWQQLMGKFVERMPARKTLIDSYLNGKAPVLHNLPLESGPAPVDTLWGFYFATGSFEPVYRIVGALMFRSRNASGDEQVRLDRTSAPYLLPRLLGLGFATGAMSGFFGIGGGFLIVPGLILATDMPMIMAVASSLVAITAFGLTTSVSYALSGLVDWPLAGVFILGGVLGGVLGGRFARHLASKKDLLARVFAVVVAIVGAYVCVTSWSGAN